MAGGVVQVDAEQYTDVRRRAKEFDPLLAKELRRALKTGGQIGADAAKARIRAMPTHGGVRRSLHRRHGNATRGRGLRSTIASGIRVQVRERDVLIVQGANGLQGRNARGLPRRLDEGAVRHPVYGNRDNWVTQPGWPYFVSAINGKRDEIEHEVADALDRAVRVIDGRL